MASDFEQDVAISHAGEDVEVARELATKLEREGVSVFFAQSQQAALLGERLEEVLARKYGATSRFVVILISEHYPIKDWARFELDIAHAEEQARGKPFVLPLRLSDSQLEQISSDKVDIDLRDVDLDDAVAILVEKVKVHRGELSVREVFDQAFRAWKASQFVPGFSKSDLFWANVRSLDLDVDRCEFLLRCPSSDGEASKIGLRRIDPNVLADAAERLIKDAESPNLRLAAIGYVGVAQPGRAEKHLWRVYRDKSATIYDRARALELFWKCPSQSARDEPRKVLADKSQPWPLRHAAAINILWGELSEDTEDILSRGLRDPRQEVRMKIVDAAVRFKLDLLSPQLMRAYKRDRSRKGKAQIKWSLRHFNTRPDVIEFGKEEGFGKAFFKPPSYIHDWEESREDWV